MLLCCLVECVSTFPCVTDIAKEMCLKGDKVADPVKFFSNMAVHLSGPSRIPGAVLGGRSGRGPYLHSKAKQYTPGVCVWD